MTHLFKNITKQQILLLFIVLLIVPQLNAQTVFQKIAQKKADYYYDIYAYPDAIKLYNKILEKDSTNTHAIRQLANAYSFAGLHKKSEVAFGKLLKNDSIDIRDIAGYCSVLKANGKYDVYEKTIRKFKDEINKSAYSKVLVPLDFETLKSDSAKYEVSNMQNINTPMIDFAPSFYKENLLVYASAGIDKNPTKTYARDGQPFLNLYSANISSENDEVNPILFGDNKLNSKFHEGAVCFDKKNEIIYFTRNNYKNYRQGKSEDKTLNLSLYKAKLMENKISDIEYLPINSKEFSTGHPALSPDGKRLYFISDRPGGVGGTDIYYCSIENDSLGKAINLGPQINTAANEMFPFVNSTGNLYFTSEGHAGFGGLDIFYAEKNADGFDAAKNIGYPINSNKDDFSFILNDKGTFGYFASNRPNGMGSDDIYKVKFIDKEAIEIKGIAKLPENKSSEITLKLKDANNREIISTTTNNKGEFIFNILNGKRYTLTLEAENYIKNVELNLESPEDVKKLKKLLANGGLNIEMEKMIWNIVGTIKDKESQQTIDNVFVNIKNNQTQEFEKITSNEKGIFTYNLRSNSSYTITTNKANYFGASLTVSTNDLPKGGTIKKDIFIDELVINKSIKLENIYYDLRKWNIRKDAEKELDRLVELLTENPLMTIELSSHTDCRGNNQFNKDLSQKRAKAAVDYIIQKGIEAKRMKAKGYGEEKLVNDCADGTDCPEEKHQENRRTEIKIISL